jgi:hypothetical protein
MQKEGRKIDRNIGGGNERRHTRKGTQMEGKKKGVKIRMTDER